MSESCTSKLNNEKDVIYERFGGGGHDKAGFSGVEVTNNDDTNFGREARLYSRIHLISQVVKYVSIVF